MFSVADIVTDSSGTMNVLHILWLVMRYDKCQLQRTSCCCLYTPQQCYSTSLNEHLVRSGQTVGCKRQLDPAHCLDFHDSLDRL